LINAVTDKVGLNTQVTGSRYDFGKITAVNELWEACVIRCIFAVLIGMAALLPRTSQTPTQAEVLPVVSISLPPTVPSETVQISYFLRGPFGGYGSFVAQRTGVLL
jgi:hypothetical protein